MRISRHATSAVLFSAMADAFAFKASPVRRHRNPTPVGTSATGLSTVSFTAGKRFQSSSRFTKSAAPQDAGGPGGVGANSQQRQQQAAGQRPPTTARAITRLRLITTVAQLQQLLTTIRNESLPASTAGAADAVHHPLEQQSPQSRDNRRRYLLRQLLCFSPSALIHTERAKVTVTVAAQVVQALGAFAGELGGQDSGLGRELAHIVEADARQNIPPAARAANGLTPAETAVLIDRYVACAHGLSVAGVSCGALEELVRMLQEVIAPARHGRQHHSSRSTTTADDLALRDETYDLFLATALRVRCVDDAVMGMRQSVDGRLMAVADHLAAWRSARLAAPGSEEYVNRKALAAAVRAAGDIVIIAGSSARSSTAETLRGHLLRSPVWRGFVAHAVTKLADSPAFLSGAELADTAALLHVAVQYVAAPTAPPCGGAGLEEAEEQSSLLASVSVLATAARDSITASADSRFVSCAGLAECITVLRCFTGAEEDEAVKLLREAVMPAVSAVLACSHDPAQVPSVSDLAELAAAFAASESLAESFPEALSASIQSHIAALGMSPENVAQFSPRAVATFVNLPVGTLPQPDRHALVRCYYEHVKAQFNENNKIFPADVACLFSRGILCPAAGVAPGTPAEKESTTFVRDLAFAVQANMKKWTVPEVFVFLQGLSQLSAELSDEADSATGGRGVAPLTLSAAVAHKEVNAILREAADFVAPFAKRRLHSGGSEAEPSAESQDEAGSAVNSAAPPATGGGFHFSPAEVVALLQTFAASRVRHDAFLENASEHLSGVFRAAVTQMELKAAATGGSAGPSITDVNAGAAASISGAGSFVATDLAGIADALSAFALLRLRNTKVFHDAAPLVVSGVADALAAGTTSSSTSNSTAAFASLTPNVVTRLLASYSMMLIWNYQVVASLSDAAKTMQKQAASTGSGSGSVSLSFTLEQLSAVQQALVTCCAKDKELSELFLTAVESALADEAEAVGAAAVNRNTNSNDAAGLALGREIGLLSILGRTSYAYAEDERAVAGFTGEAGSGTVNTFDHFAYVAPSGAFAARTREVAAALATSIVDRTAAISAADPTAQLEPALVAEVLISLSRVHLFDHPLFAALKRESLSAVVRLRDSLSLSQLTLAVALACVVDRQQQEGEEASAGDTAAAAHDPFYDEFFSLASATTLRLNTEMKLSAATLTHVLHAFSVAGHRDDKLFVTVLPKMKLLSMYGSFEEISAAFYSFAKNNLWHQKLFARLADRVVDTIKKENILHKQQLLLILESLASVGYAYDRLFDLVAVRFLTVLHLCSVEDVRRLVHCYAKLNYRASSNNGGGDGLAKAVLSSHDVLYAACCDRVVDVWRAERQGGRQDFLARSEPLKAAARALLTDLADAGAHHEAILEEVRQLFPDLAKEFAVPSS